MQRTLALATLAALLLAAIGSNSRADSNTPPPRLFDDDLARAEASSEAVAAIDELVQKCEYTRHSRSGPRPDQIAGCEKSVARAVAVGPSIVPIALRQLNSQSMGYGARLRTYDVLARVGDVRSLESLVIALERTERDPNDRTDRDFILHTLARISYAKVGEVSGLGDVRPDTTAEVAAWRSWLGEHRGMSRSQLLDDRIADARAHVGDPDLDTAFIAARFLAQRKETQHEGLALLDALLERPNLPNEAPARIRTLIRRIAPAPAPAKNQSPAPKRPEEKPRNSAATTTTRAYS
jgi:hypothetical protein